MKKMNNDIEKNSIIKRKDLDERFYFQSLINRTFELEILDIDIVSNLQLQCFELLKARVERYNGFDSTSISKDKANSIMESNLYTIGLYLKKFSPDESIEKLRSDTIIDIYDKGRKYLYQKIDISRALYEKVINNKINVDNITYNDTIIGGIEGFFKIYDPDFEANNIKITADYPLYNNLIGILDGIEFIEEYLKSIYYENEFCNLFSEISIKYLLYGYAHDYKDLIINLFEITLIASIGSIIAEEDVTRLTISSGGLERIYRKMLNRNKEEIYQLVAKSYNQLKDILFKDNIELQKYIEKGLEKIQFQIYNLFKIKALDKAFIIEKIIGY